MQGGQKVFRKIIAENFHQFIMNAMVQTRCFREIPKASRLNVRLLFIGQFVESLARLIYGAWYNSGNSG